MPRKNLYPKTYIKLDKNKVMLAVDTSRTPSDALEKLYRMVIPEWETAEKIIGYPKVNSETSNEISKMFLERFGRDSLWLLMNKGFSVDDSVPDWEVDLSDVKVKRKEKSFGEPTFGSMFGRYDYIEIAPSPVNECCVQVGDPDYERKSLIECRVFKKQLIRQFGPPPPGARLAIKSFPHDFGTYREVVCYFEEGNEEAESYAFRLEDETPEYWDEEAKKELKEAFKCRCSLE